MKHLKTYESIVSANIDNEPQIGDYVLIKSPKSMSSTNLKNFWATHVGQIKKILKDQYGPGSSAYHVIYKDKYNGEHSRWVFNRKEIIHFSKNKEDIEMLINAEKYNL